MQAFGFDAGLVSLRDERTGRLHLMCQENLPGPTIPAFEQAGVGVGYIAETLCQLVLDAGDTLSVQVHPSDEDCRRLGCSDRGKAECWVILEAQPGARINRGLKPGVTRAALARPLHNGHMNEILHYLRVRPGDLIAIPPGMVHTIGPGIILAEIQQNSDVTFRVHDWHRAGADGEKRELHLEQALEIIRFDRPAEGFFDGDMTQGKLAEGVLDGSGSVVTGTILKGRYFHLSRTVLAPGVPFSPPERPALPGIVMCVRGRGTLNGRPLATGQTVLLPADLRKLWWSVPASEREPLVFLESTPMLEV
jgi:mannose-6-phosphate isomerase class I